MNTTTIISNKILWDQIVELIVPIESRELKQLKKHNHLWEDLKNYFRDEIEKNLYKSIIIYYHHLLASSYSHDDIIDLIKNRTFAQLFKNHFQILIQPLENFLISQKKYFLKVIKNFENDRFSFKKSFNIDPTDVILKINLNLSDPHNNGESVYILIFLSGKKLVFKPRSAKAENAFLNFVKTLNQNLTHKHYLPLFLEREDYHWAEYIEHSYCQNEQELFAYHYRIGSLIAISYALCATDFHYENLISKGEFPILIDLDSLLQPTLKSNKDADHSVMQTGLLPSRLWNSVEKKYTDVSGIASNIETESIRTTLSDINQKNWNIERHPTKNITLKNKPLPEKYCASSFLENIKQGFEETYSIFLEMKKLHLNLEDSPLAFFKNISTRFIHRNTVEYERLRIGQLHPLLNYNHELRNQYLLCLNKIPRYFETSLELIDAEKRALSQMNIPYFWTTSDTLDIFYKTETGLTKKHQDFFESCGYDGLIKRWTNKISKNDLKRQLWFIESSLAVISKDNLKFNFNPFDLKDCAQILKYLLGENPSEHKHWINFNSEKMSFIEITDENELYKLNKTLTYITDFLKQIDSKKQILLPQNQNQKSDFNINDFINLKVIDLKFLREIDRLIFESNANELNYIFNRNFEINFNTPSNILLPLFENGFLGLAYISVRLNGAPSIFSEEQGVYYE